MPKSRPRRAGARTSSRLEAARASLAARLASEAQLLAACVQQHFVAARSVLHTPPVRCAVIVAATAPRAGPPPTRWLVDLFHGAGGFARGASRAGYEVVLAFDNCAHASETYAANFPCAERVLDTLGAGGLGEVAAAARVVAALGTDGGHLHASPPCQKVSGYNTSASAAERAQGVALTLWCVRVAARVRAHYARAGREAAFTFTLEQVVSLPVKAALETEGIAYAVVNAAFHGVPQSRRRLIVASPRALAALAARASERPTVAACALALPARAMLQIGTDNTPVRGGGHRPIRADECLRDPRTQPAHTVTSRGLRLIGCGHGLVRTTLEMDCALQTLGPPHVLLGNVTRQRKLCADAVPPALAEALMRAVRSVA